MKPVAPNPAADNIRAIVDIERQITREAGLGERIGDTISQVIGSMTFVTLHSVAMLLWIGWNVWAPQPSRFDPYPFGLLTFIVSLEGVLIATFVLIAQNRMTRQTDQRDRLNLQIDLLAEQEMTVALKMLRRISERLHVPPEDEDAKRTEKLAEETNVYELVRTMRDEDPRG